MDDATPTRCRHQVPTTHPEQSICSLAATLGGIPSEFCRVLNVTCVRCKTSGVPEGDKWNAAFANQLLVSLARARSQNVHPVDAEKAAAARLKAAGFAKTFRPVANIPSTMRPCVHRGEVIGRKLCSSCRGVVHLKVYQCNHAAHESATMNECRTCSDYSPVGKTGVIRHWAVGMTTAPRDKATLADTLASLSQAGWENPLVFAEPNSPGVTNILNLVQRPRLLGAWPNWFLGLSELVIRYPTADAYMMVQDDVLFTQGARAYLERTLWPDQKTGVVSLFNPARHADQRASGFVIDSRAGDATGALAYVFTHDSVRSLLGHMAALNHRRDEGQEGVSGIDRVITRWCREAQLLQFVHTPSLVQHIGDTSTLYPRKSATAGRVASSWAGGGRPEVSDHLKTPADVFDGIYILSIPRRQPKLDVTLSRLARFGIKPTVVVGVDASAAPRSIHRRAAAAGCSPAEYACLHGHRRVLRIAKKSGHRSYLVFEDDILLHENFLTEFQRLTLLPSWKLVYLGASQYGWADTPPGPAGFYRCRGTQGTFALAVHASAYPAVTAALRYKAVDTGPVDYRLAETVQKHYRDECFTCYPNIVVADVSSSDLRRQRFSVARHAQQMHWRLEHFGLTGGYRRARAVLAITTYNRQPYLKQLLDTWQATHNHRWKWQVLVADDGSSDTTIDYLLHHPLHRRGMLHLIRHQRVGVHQQTNSLLLRLQDLRYDVCFKVDDDVFFTAAGWDDLYLRAMRRTGYSHLVHHSGAWNAGNYVPAIVHSSGLLESHVDVAHSQGAFFTVTPDIVERVGFFDVNNFGKRGHGHIDFSMRCCRAGFNEMWHLWDAAHSERGVSLQPRQGYVSAASEQMMREASAPHEVKRRESIIADPDRLYIPFSQPHAGTSAA